MFCGKCGRKVAEGNTFCTGCGERVHDASSNSRDDAFENASLKVKGLIESLFVIGDLDFVNDVLKNYDFDMTGRKLINLELLKYCIYLCSADCISDRVVKFINYQLGSNDNILVFKHIHDKIFSDVDTFLLLIPFSLRITTEVDKLTKSDYRDSHVDVYRCLGKLLLHFLGNNNTDKYDAYINMLENFTSSKGDTGISLNLQNTDTKITDDSANESIPIGERNALVTAKRYVTNNAFSYKGLVQQLEYEGYTLTQSKYGADNCGADWYDQSLKSAKRYVTNNAFSYKGLIEQLEYEEFTSEQAKHGADNCNANWKEQAAKAAQRYLKNSSFSREGLIEQLEYEGYTREQALHGVTSCGY